MKILVVDDHALVREGLCQVLKGLDEHVEVLQAGHCEQAFAFARANHDLDLVLLDYHLPDMTGLAALDIFGKRHPELPIILLSGSVNPRIMRQVMQAGAAGFITKSSLSDELLHVVRRVLDGEIYMPQELGTRPTPTPPVYCTEQTLTQRQELVLRGLLDGRSNREIALTLKVSEETVKTHVTAILRYFKVQNRTQAVVAAERTGTLSVGNR